MESIKSEPKLVTAVDLYNMPGHGGRNELVQGEIVPMSPASTMHGNIAMRLGAILWNYSDENDLGRVFAAETGFTLSRNPDTVRAPDVAFVAKERIPAAGVPETGFWAIAPDLVAEVVSPNDRMTEIQDKVTDYLAAGVRLVWVVDPKTATITVYQSLKQVKVLIAEDTLEGEDVLSGFQLPLKKLFA
jgi:Uma2 family endonuclease